MRDALHLDGAAQRRVANDRLTPADQLWADDVVSRVLRSCHPKQRQFVEDPGRRVAALVGRGGGKTTAQVARLIIKLVRTPRARCVYIATTKEHARELIWDKLKDSLTRLGIESKFNETRLTVEIKRNGARLKLTGADDNKEIDKLRGMSFHEVAIDEAASHEHKLLERLIKRVVGPRLGEFGGCICLFGTPGHDLRGMFYEATFPGLKDKLNIPTNRPYEDRDKPEYDRRCAESMDYRPALDKETGTWSRWSSHYWTIYDGAPYVKALRDELAENLIEKEANGWSDDHPVWQREYLGRWAADDTEMMFKYRPQKDGADWNQWDPDKDHQGFAKLPNAPDGKPRTDWLYAYGFDMGHSDPFACVVFAFSPSDTTRSIYHVYSLSKTKMYSRLIAQLLLGTDEKQPSGCSPHEKMTGLFKTTDWPIGMVADVTHLGPMILDELTKVYGIKIEPAEQKAKFAAIELFNGDLIDGRLKILKGSLLEDQLSRLQWQPDEFGRLREPKGVANHEADGGVYARRLIAHLFDTGAVDAPKSTTHVPNVPGLTPEHVRAAVMPEVEEPYGMDLEEPNWGDLYK